MSRAGVRATVAAYMSATPVEGLGMILPNPPRDLRGIEFTNGAPGVMSGAIAVVSIEGQSEQAQAFDGAGGGRVTTYVVGLQIFHRSAEPNMTDVTAHFDMVVDGVLNLLRSDPSLGVTDPTNPIINGAYEGLSVEYGESEQMQPDSGLVQTWAVVRFPVTEWNQVT